MRCLLVAGCSSGGGGGGGAEPKGNTIDDAIPIVLDDPVTGDIGGKGDSNWYNIEITAYEMHTFTLNTTADLCVTIYGPDGVTWVFSSCNPLANQQLYTPILGAPVTDYAANWHSYFNGTHYMLVEGMSDDGTGDYNILITPANPFDLDGDGYFAYEDDCDDSDPLINPGAEEIPDDGLDNNCDGLRSYTYFLDDDGDGYGLTDNTTVDYSLPEGYSAVGGDCDDDNRFINPAASEICEDGIDQDCSGADLICVGTGDDVDGDGYTVEEGDCNDYAPEIHPGADEILDDGVDNNCDGLNPMTYYIDNDHDGYGGINAIGAVYQNHPGVGHSLTHDDCNDGTTTVHPNAYEDLTDGIDNDCDGISAVMLFFDGDGDGYGDPAKLTILSDAEEVPEGYVTDDTDCDDGNAGINRVAIEIAGDGIDQNCDGYDYINYYLDSDGDGYGDSAHILPGLSVQTGYVNNSSDCDDSDRAVNPGNTEVCDGIDNDCDGTIDEACVTAITVPGDYATIQEAIITAVDGDVILVGDGTYVENLDFLGKALTLKSINGAVATIIDGNASGSVIKLDATQATVSVIDGFTITNGSGTVVTEPDPPGRTYHRGGGIYVDGATLTVKNSIVTNNELPVVPKDGGGVYSYNHGGGIYSINAPSLTVTNCTIAVNASGGEGGGIYSSDTGSVTIDNSFINSNIACEFIDAYGVRYTGGGGGIYCDGADSLTITGSHFLNNKASDGGGISLVGTRGIFSALNVSNTSLDANTGGAISIAKGIYHTGNEHIPLLTMHNCSATNNSADGGGIYAYEADVTVTSTRFHNNGSESARGGAIYAKSAISHCNLGIPDIQVTVQDCYITSNSGSRGGAVYLKDSVDAVISDCIIRDNGAEQGGYGGGILAAGYEDRILSLSVTGCVITGHTGTYGGGFNLSGNALETLVDISDCQIYSNTASRGAGIYGVLASLSNSIIVGNIAHRSGGLKIGGGTEITNSIIAYNHTTFEGSREYFGGGSATNCTIVNNSSSPFLNDPDTKISFSSVTNSIIWNSGDKFFVSAGSVTYSCVKGGYAGEGNISEDPGFEYLGFKLAADSPCIDTGTGIGAPLVDIEGIARPQGAGYDMGVYEYVP